MQLVGKKGYHAEMAHLPIGSKILTASPVMPLTSVGSDSTSMTKGVFLSVQASSVTRSGTSITLVYKTSGFCIVKSNNLGRDWFPM
jgi:hypothetical protein